MQAVYGWHASMQRASRPPVGAATGNTAKRRGCFQREEAKAAMASEARVVQGEVEGVEVRGMLD